MAVPLASICVYCGSSAGARPQYRALAEELGTVLASRGIRLVYGGGRVGLMGAVADACLAAGGSVVGVIPQALVARELAHDSLENLEIVRDMHERKMRMAELSDAFIALPGGWGTLEELTEMLTWLQLGLHKKPVGLLEVAGYFEHFLAFARHMNSEGFVRHEHTRLLCVDKHPGDLLAQLENFDALGVGLL